MCRKSVCSRPKEQVPLPVGEGRVAELFCVLIEFSSTGFFEAAAAAVYEVLVHVWYLKWTVRMAFCRWSI